jgi:hypothetical protein
LSKGEWESPAVRQSGYLSSREARNFAPPPRDGFALLAAHGCAQVRHVPSLTWRVYLSVYTQHRGFANEHQPLVVRVRERRGYRQPENEQSRCECRGEFLNARDRGSAPHLFCPPSRDYRWGSPYAPTAISTLLILSTDLCRPGAVACSKTAQHQHDRVHVRRGVGWGEGRAADHQLLDR